MQSVDAIVMHLRNTGTLPIEEADFRGPIIFDFGNQAEIIGLRVPSDVPPLGLLLKIAKNTVQVGPGLLNPGDELDLMVLVAQYNDTLIVSGRISGVSSIKNRDRGKKAIRVQ